MRLDELRVGLDELARTQPDPDRDGGRRSVAGRVRRRRRRTRLTSLATVIIIVTVGALSIHAGRADRADVDVTSGVGPFPHLVPSYVPGGLTPTYETFDSSGHEIPSAEGLLSPVTGPGYAITWGEPDDSGRVRPTSPDATYLNVVSATEDLEAIRLDHPGASAVEVGGTRGLLSPLPNAPGGWFVVWTLSDGGTALVARPCASDCPPDEALKIARSVHPVDQVEWQQFLSRQPSDRSSGSVSPP